MGENSAIEWTHHSFNPWVGCTKISPACDHCYAEGWAKRSGLVIWGGQRRRTTQENWDKPLRWNAAAGAAGIRQRVFCASLADVFDNAVPLHWRADLFRLIRQTPHLDWLLLTKRIGNARQLIERALLDGHLLTSREPAWPWPNVWVGATVVTQEEADRDVPKLLQVPVRGRFLSIEPMLGPVDISRWLWPVHPRWPARFSSPEAAIAAGEEVTYHPQSLISASAALVDWVIVGGESGPQARPMHPEWARSIRTQCLRSATPFLFKQWGEWLAGEVYSKGTAGGFARHQDGTDGVHAGKPDHWWAGDCFSGIISTKVGKAAAGRELDGHTFTQFPKFGAR